MSDRPVPEDPGVGQGWDPDPSASRSLHADAYTQPPWFEVDQRQIIGRTWQWLCHAERLQAPGSYVCDLVADMPVVAVRGRDGVLRCFYNVCKHRAHHLVEGSGVVANLVCPYHG